jgi:LPS export ABC transporter protein LptC
MLKGNFETTKQNLIAIIYSIVTVISFSCQNNNIEQIKTFSHPPGAPELVADTIEMLYSDSAIIRFRLECPKLLIYEDEEEPYNEFPDGFKITQYDKNRKVIAIIMASYGKKFQKKELWEAKQNVVIVTEKGDSLKTELLYWDQKKELIYTDQYVKIIQPDKNITGVGFESDMQMRKWKIIKPRGPISIEVEENQ